MIRGRTLRRVQLDQIAEVEIKRALQEKGCPICRICKERLSRSLFWFLSESYAEGSGVTKYVNDWGFCYEHTRLVAQMGPAWQKSAIYQLIIKSHLPEIERLLENLQRLRGNFFSKIIAKMGFRRMMVRLRTRGTCIFCETLSQTARYYSARLLDIMHDSEIRKSYESSEGLCMPHFVNILEQASIEYFPQLLEIAEMQIKRLKELEDSFQEFFRKGDYRFSDEPKGEEQTTWIRAIRKLLGEVDLGID